MRVIIQIMFKKPLSILRNNMIFIQPLLLYLLLLMTALTFVLAKEMYFISKCMLLLSTLLMTIAFSAGWFYVNKLGVENYNGNDEPDTIATKAIENIKKFFVGVGENFFKSLNLKVEFTDEYFHENYTNLFDHFKYPYETNTDDVIEELKNSYEFEKHENMKPEVYEKIMKEDNNVEKIYKIIVYPFRIC